MTDHYAACKSALITRLQTLTTYFPAAGDRAAGWQVSSDDAVLSYGGDYFSIIRPGQLPIRKLGRILEVDWHMDVVLYVRFTTQSSSWERFEAFRGAIFNLLTADPTLGKAKGVYDVGVSAQDKAGRLQDSQGNLMNWIAQILDVTISQRINQFRA